MGDTTYIGSGIKGDCFQNTYNYVLDNDDNNMIVVHGNVTNFEGKTFPHAWVEEGDTVIDPTTGVKTAKEKYYQLLKAQPEGKYDAIKAIGITIRSKNYGPWTPQEVGNNNLMKEEKKPNIDPHELAVGREVEKEHDPDPKKSTKVATQHLEEPGNSNYYTKLYKAGLVNEPEAKKLAKKYLVNERQLKFISENVIKEVPENFNVGDMVMLQEPVQGVTAPPNTKGVVKHIDALGTLAVEFQGYGVGRIDPENDAIIKINDSSIQPLNENITTPLSLTSNKGSRKTFLMSIKDDEFIHFTIKSHLMDIIKQKTLDSSLKSELFGASFAISTRYGKFVPNTQLYAGGNRQKNGDEFVAIKFRTNTPPAYGYIEEVVWHKPVKLKNISIISLENAAMILKNTPYQIGGQDMVLYRETQQTQ